MAVWPAALHRSRSVSSAVKTALADFGAIGADDQLGKEVATFVTDFSFVGARLIELRKFSCVEL